jgi:hypothetical protein
MRRFVLSRPPVSLFREQEVAGSNPAAPTIEVIEQQADTKRPDSSESQGVLSRVPMDPGTGRTARVAALNRSLVPDYRGGNLIGTPVAEPE